MAPIVWTANQSDLLSSMVFMDGLTAMDGANGWNDQGCQIGFENCGTGRSDGSGTILSSGEPGACNEPDFRNSSDDLGRSRNGVRTAPGSHDEGFFDRLMTADLSTHEPLWADPAFSFAEEFFSSAGCDGTANFLLQPPAVHNLEAAAALHPSTRAGHQPPPRQLRPGETEPQVQSQGRAKKTRPGASPAAAADPAATVGWNLDLLSAPLSSTLRKTSAVSAGSAGVPCENPAGSAGAPCKNPEAAFSNAGYHVHDTTCAVAFSNDVERPSGVPSQRVFLLAPESVAEMRAKKNGDGLMSQGSQNSSPGTPRSAASSFCESGVRGGTQSTCQKFPRCQCSESRRNDPADSQVPQEPLSQSVASATDNQKQPRETVASASPASLSQALTSAASSGRTASTGSAKSGEQQQQQRAQEGKGQSDQPTRVVKPPDLTQRLASAFRLQAQKSRAKKAAQAQAQAQALSQAPVHLEQQGRSQAQLLGQPQRHPQGQPQAQVQKSLAQVQGHTRPALAEQQQRLLAQSLSLVQPLAPRSNAQQPQQQQHQHQPQQHLQQQALKGATSGGAVDVRQALELQALLLQLQQGVGGAGGQSGGGAGGVSPQLLQQQRALIEHIQLLQQQHHKQQQQQQQQQRQQQQQHRQQQQGLVPQQQHHNHHHHEQQQQQQQHEATTKRPLAESQFAREFEFESMRALRAAETRALEDALTSADRIPVTGGSTGGALAAASAGSARGATDSSAAAAAPGALAAAAARGTQGDGYSGFFQPGQIMAAGLAGAAPSAAMLAAAGRMADAGAMDGVVGVTGGTAGSGLATDLEMVSQVRLRMDPKLLASLDAMRAHSQQGEQLRAYQQQHQPQQQQQFRQLQQPMVARQQQQQALPQGVLEGLFQSPAAAAPAAAPGAAAAVFPPSALGTAAPALRTARPNLPHHLPATTLPTPITPIPPSPSLFGCSEDIRAIPLPTASDGELRSRLLRLAEAVATSDEREMSSLSLLLREDATPHGTPMQRVVHYLLGALQKRVAGSLGVEYVEEPPQTAEEEALILAFAARNPLMQYCYTAMACGIHEAVENEPLVHIVDFAMWGGQWPVVIRQLATAAARRRRESCTSGCADGGADTGRSSSGSGSSSSNCNSSSAGLCNICSGPLPLHIRYTAVEPPPGHPWGAGPKIPIPFLQAEVSGAAAECGVALTFQRVEGRPETLRPLMLGIQRGEAVVVNCAGRLANLADSTVLRSSPKDAALSTILQLNPKVLTVVEWDANHRQPFFLHRFRDCLDFFSNVFLSHDHLAARSAFGRRGFEELVLAREMVNLVACEGLQRVVRAETLDQLHERMRRVGFAAKPFSRRTMAALGQMLEPYSKGFSVGSHPMGGMRLLFGGKSMLGASFWQPAMVAQGSS